MSMQSALKTDIEIRCGMRGSFIVVQSSTNTTERQFHAFTDVDDLMAWLAEQAQMLKGDKQGKIE